VAEKVKDRGKNKKKGSFKKEKPIN